MAESVIYTEVSLRRNYQDLRFCPQNHQQDLQESHNRSQKALKALWPDGKLMGSDALITQGVPYLQQALLPKDFHKAGTAALYVEEHQGASAAINMDEHLVIKAAGELAQLDTLVQSAREAEAALEAAGYAFARDKDFGYLSYRPSLSGSGLYINVVLHLPMLHFLKQIKLLGAVLGERKCELRPLTHPDGRNPGRLFVLCNLSSFHREDRQIIADIIEMAEMLTQKERMLRDKALTKNGESTFADQVWRAYGILRYARRLSTNDFLAHWSGLRMGSLAGILPITPSQADSLLEFANDQAFLSEGAEPKTIVTRRADSIRNALSGG